MKLQRLIAILTMLLQTDRIPASHLAEKFEVSVRTVYRDIEALEGAGIPIVTYPGIHGGVGIVEQYKIDKGLFTHKDLATLLTGLASVTGSIAAPTLNATLEKIRGLIPEGYSTVVEASSRQLLIDLSPWSHHPHIQTAFHLCQQAVEQNRLLVFEYSSKSQQASCRTVEPHQLILKENSWYLRAYCHLRSDFRIFKLNRMVQLEVLSEEFVPRPFDNAVPDFKDWQSDQMITVELLVDQSLRDRVLQYCKEEMLTDVDEQTLHINLPFVESDLGYGVLLSMGERCRVLSPEHVRKELVRRVERLRALYP